MKDKKGRSRMQCLKPGCDCDECTKEKDFGLCAYCDHAPVLHKVEDNFNLVEDIELAHFSKSNAIQNTISKPAILSRSEIDFNNKVMSPMKKQCIQQAKPFQDSTGKVVSVSKTVLHHKSNTLFENGLAPILNSCTDGMIVLSASNLTFSLRSKFKLPALNCLRSASGLQKHLFTKVSP
ncbi:uncharacterized protein LOC136082404 isoform X3 [Hydra vulgaris]|uniref:Uncharacterized protein LOC136082404 isoform X3 n=1 Tax=Hydra vulgaris TaxID=6087 RepID=A0ABM4C7U6_HYDVU